MKAHRRPGSDSLWVERARFYGGYLLAKGFEDLPLMRKTRVEQSLGFETSMSAIAFHEKAGRSQVVSLSFLFVTRFFSAELPTVSTLPSALFDERVFSLGASWVFSFQLVLPPDCRPPVPSEMEVGPGD